MARATSFVRPLRPDGTGPGTPSPTESPVGTPIMPMAVSAAATAVAAAHTRNAVLKPLPRASKARLWAADPGALGGRLFTAMGPPAAAISRAAAASAAGRTVPERFVANADPAPLRATAPTDCDADQPGGRNERAEPRVGDVQPGAQQAAHRHQGEPPGQWPGRGYSVQQP
ncbi:MULTISPECIES: hypothetical protein [unclassified Streptomyces]|uniref:hypothetical protein n=1 Tax=unclassified Streptomyces TaxID=2593676 RepID=UPI001587A49D|nr:MULTISPECIES: hypothetical protein [unclassified Streptomyces]NUV95683.1 hypothetical protein [Streptomyces sp. KAI 90]